MMTSVDWKQRFIAEYIQLKIRIQKLMNYINSFEEQQEIKEEDKFNIDLLKQQHSLMKKYLFILKLRAIMSDIEIPL